MGRDILPIIQCDVNFIMIHYLYLSLSKDKAEFYPVLHVSLQFLPIHNNLSPPLCIDLLLDCRKMEITTRPCRVRRDS